MKDMQPKNPRPSQGQRDPGTEIDYSPRTYTAREQFASALKALAVAGAIGLLIWVMNAMSS